MRLVKLTESLVPTIKHKVVQMEVPSPHGGVGYCIDVEGFTDLYNESDVQAIGDRVEHEFDVYCSEYGEVLEVQAKDDKISTNFYKVNELGKEVADFIQNNIVNNQGGNNNETNQSN